MTPALRARLPLLTAASVALLYLVFASIYVTGERPNQDEGWYLMAARLVRAGELPYRDFAYPQPPLMPYVYGLLGADRDMLTGRSVSLGFGLLTVLLAMTAAWRGGAPAGLTAGLLMALTPFVLSQQSIVKAYALTNCLLAGGLAVGLRARSPRLAAAGAAALFALAALTRNSAAPALLAWWLWLAADRQRRSQLGPAVVAGVTVLLVGYLPFIWTDIDSVRYHVLEHHAQNRYGGGVVGLAINLVVVFRQMVAACSPLAVLLLVALLWVGPGDRTGFDLFGVGVALLQAGAVGLGHFISFHPYQEYQILTVPAATVAAGLAWGHVVDRAADRRLPLLVGVTVAGLVPLLAMGPVTAGLPGEKPGPDGRRSPLGVFGPLERVAELVRTVSPPDGELFTFQTDVAIQARRPLCPGLTMASFSFTAEADAAERGRVNPAIITDYFQTARPAVVVLSPGDLAFLLRGEFVNDDELQPQASLDPAARAVYGPLVEALAEHYELVGRVEQVGQFFETFHVFCRLPGAGQ